jgi:hypothetical protein
VVQRISQLVGDHPEIVELDVNPWLAFPSGGAAVDGRMMLGEARPAPQHEREVSLAATA